ncbi:hypothetical protein F5B20DRAFT_538936 [Whalleya microplaca]|nr:hypothetical protein F5B20DRAFT_538936 [Whalleya microplaca]
MSHIKHKGEEQIRLALRALSWVTFTKRPLTIEELLEAIREKRKTSTASGENLQAVESIRDM